MARKRKQQKLETESEPTVTQQVEDKPQDEPVESKEPTEEKRDYSKSFKIKRH